MRALIMFLAAAVLLFPLTANAIDVSGDQWGTWTRDNSPYNVVGEIRVPPESTLVIEPGIVVDFQGHYKFIVDSLATLRAVGTETDSIYFTTEDTATGWHGIRFFHADSNSQVSYCLLQYGKAFGEVHDWSGGAIYGEYSSPIISHNTISGNWAEWCAGGIYFGRDSSPRISNNLVSENVAEMGGGICCAGGGSAEISNNTITRNWAGARGGGIYCHNSSPVIGNNSISRNSANLGGGVACYKASPTIRNTILWADTASTGPEIYLQENSNPTVTYSDVQSGWPGLGNVDARPRFVGPRYHDFRLRWGSPCINAGDPTSPLDPDSTRSDMGAYYFNQDVDGIVEVYPRRGPIVIPPWGGNVYYDGCVVNFCDEVLIVDIWASAFVPGLSRPRQIWQYSDITVPPRDSIRKYNQIERVPGFAPAGDYSFVTYIGDYPSSIIDSSYFYFTKEEGHHASAGSDHWQTLKGWFEGEFMSTESGLPTAYALTQNHPNPFNATTVIEYALPVESHVKLQVYNVRGQKVATLVDSKQQAGYRSVNWDASGVSSGIYFYKLTAGSKVFSERMMLLK